MAYVHYLDYEKIATLYKEGLSTRGVASKLGYSATWVSILIKKMGLSRSKSQAGVLSHPAKSNHWRTSRNTSRSLYERHYGVKLPSDQHVHHKNDDFTDRRIENLEVLSASEHGKHHHPPNPVPRWLRPERQKYMKKYLENYRRKNAAKTDLL